MISYSITEHVWGFPTKVVSGYGGDHIYNIHLTADTDNCTLVGRGAWEGLDIYTQDTAPTFAGIIREQAKNGNWYIEVTADTEALFVYDAPVIAEDYNKKFSVEKNFYNESGKVVKAYSLNKGDLLEVSALGFTGTPAANKAVSFASGKYVVAS